MNRKVKELGYTVEEWNSLYNRGGCSLSKREYIFGSIVGVCLIQGARLLSILLLLYFFHEILHGTLFS